MRIMVTRPRPQGEVLCQHIRESGHEAIYFPTLEIVPLEPHLEKIDQYDWLIFTSPQAVYQVAARLAAMWSSLSQLPQLAAIGLGTAQALKKNNFTVSVYPQGEWSSEGLLQLPEFQVIAEQKIGLIQGEGGRERLAPALRARGATVTPLIVYRRSLPQSDVSAYIHLLQHHKIDIIVATSTEGMRNLLTLVGIENKTLVQSLPLLVISERLKVEAKKLGFSTLWVAENAGHESILQVLKRISHGK